MTKQVPEVGDIFLESASLERGGLIINDKGHCRILFCPAPEKVGHLYEFSSLNTFKIERHLYLCNIFKDVDWAEVVRKADPRSKT